MQLNVSSEVYNANEQTVFFRRALENDTSSPNGQLEQALGAPAALVDLTCNSGCSDAGEWENYSNVWEKQRKKNVASLFCTKIDCPFHWHAQKLFQTRIESMMSNRSFCSVFPWNLSIWNCCYLKIIRNAVRSSLKELKHSVMIEDTGALVIAWMLHTQCTRSHNIDISFSSKTMNRRQKKHIQNRLNLQHAMLHS